MEEFSKKGRIFVFNYTAKEIDRFNDKFHALFRDKLKTIIIHYTLRRSRTIIIHYTLMIFLCNVSVFMEFEISF